MYRIDLDKAVQEIRKHKAEKVMLQLPDGLKPNSQAIQRLLKDRTNAGIFIWAGSCYGSCDLATETKKLGADLLIHFGHAKWKQ